MIRGVREVRVQDPYHQFALENPAYSYLRQDGQMSKYFGEGIVVHGCAYWGRITGKEYRFWMAAETLEVFLERQIKPTDAADRRSVNVRDVQGEPTAQSGGVPSEGSRQNARAPAG